MRLLLLILFLLSAVAAFSQSAPLYGTAVGYVNGAPTFTPNVAQKGSELCVSINRKMLYLWNRDSSEWKPLGGITVSFGVPVTAPAAAGGTRTAINMETGLLYWWNGSAWKEIISYSVELAGAYSAEVAELYANEVRAELADSTAELRALIAAGAPPSGAAGGDLTGTYPDPLIGNGKVISANVLDGTLVNADLAGQTLDSNKVKNGAVTWVKLAQPVKDSIAAATGETNLGYATDANTGTITNDNGTPAVIPEATDLDAGLLSATKKLQYDAKNSGIQFKDEGTNLGTQGTINEVNVTGSGATASRTGNAVTISVMGGGGGILAWNSSTSYSANDMAFGSDQNLYKAVTSSTNQNPTTDNGTYWVPINISASVTLNVPSRFTTIHTALAYLKNATIGNDVIAKIKVADGTYNYGVDGVDLSHPCGSRIELEGNTTTPSNCVIQTQFLTGSTEPGLFYLIDGGTFRKINGFRLVSTNGNVGIGKGAIYAMNNSQIATGGKMEIVDHYWGILAWNNSHVECDSIKVSGGGDGNLFAYGASSISFHAGESWGANTHYFQAGAVVEHGSHLWARGATFRNNKNGLLIGGTSNAQLEGATIRDNTELGMLVASASSVDEISVTYSGNGVANKKLIGFSATYDSWQAKELGGNPNFSIYQPSGGGLTKLGINATASSSSFTGQIFGNVADYDGVLVKNANTSGNTFHSLQNNNGQDLTFYIKSTSHARTVYGLSSGTVFADVTANGLPFSVGTFSAHPFILGTTNTERLRILSGGNIGIGTTAPTAYLHIKAGTNSAGGAPLKFTSGLNLVSTEAGAIEFSSNRLYFTPTTERYSFFYGSTVSATLDFPNTTPGSHSDLTVTLTGAVDGDAVSLGVLNAVRSVAGTDYRAWVSSANTITIRFLNTSGADIDPISAVFNFAVAK
jgi:hypothetical protein